MADDQDKREDEDFGALTGGSSGEEDTGFGTSSLPPLSDFDSASSGGEEQMDSDLPPLDSPGAGEEDDDSFSGLPPIVDIRVDTPAVRPSDLDTPTPSKGSKATPARGRVTPPRSGQATTPSPAGFSTPSDADINSPSDGGFGFQDFAADSDFSPETPEVGPGPDSDIETPMFDSAFGGDSDEFSSGISSSAPTQAMQTPMFGGGDDDAFGGASPDFGADAGTPVPDFSPDTGAGLRDSGATPIGASGGVPPKRGSRLVSAIISVVLLIVGLAAGAFVGPHLIGKVPGIANPFAGDLEQKDQEISRLNKRIADLTKMSEKGPAVTQEELDKLVNETNAARAEKARLDEEMARITEELSTLDNRLVLVKADIEDKNNEFVEAQSALEDLQNQAAITQARHTGLLTENERLTNLVGELEVANARRQATKDTLEHNAELLIVQIQGGSPLTPERYDYQRRLQRATELRDKIAQAKWVDPQLLDEYTSLYLAELAIASSREYFFARIPVQDTLNQTYYRWAECLMNGNWSVYFRTIDGNTVGSYENTAGSGPPQYEFRQDIQSGLRGDIVNALESARPEDWKEKFQVLREKQKIYEAKSNLQRDYESIE